MKRLINSLMILVVIFLALMPSLPSFGMSYPDSPPQVNGVYVFELDDGGLGVLVDYYLDYTGNVTEIVTDAYLVIFVDTDNTTQLKATAPYTYVSSGYGRGAVWMRFTADEVTAYGLTSTNQTLYHIWLVGNPTVASGWTADPPKIIASIDQWNTTGDPAVLISLRVLSLADILELAWTLDLIEATSLGNKLTTTGADYFENVIPGLRILSPSCFSSTSLAPTLETIDYSTSFGATMVNGPAPGGGIVVGSPITLGSGATVVNVLGTGTFTLTLAQGTSGNVTSGVGGVVTGSPVSLVVGTNTITVTAIGTLTVRVAQRDTTSSLEDTVIGTGFDLTNVAAAFGLSRWMFSGILWLIIAVLICAAVYKVSPEQYSGMGASKIILPVFIVCIVGGTLMGLLHPKVASVLFIGFAGFFAGYVLFFRGANEPGKLTMFFAWVWLITCLTGGFMLGSMPFATNYLTSSLTDSDTTVTVNSTNGFPVPGVLIVGNTERIAYSNKTATTFIGTFARPMVRGSGGTTAVAHTSGESIRMVESMLINNAVDYDLAIIADSAGAQAFLSVPTAIFDIILSFGVSPFKFLGTDLAILTPIWAVCFLGMLVSFFIAMAGGRRV